MKKVFSSILKYMTLSGLSLFPSGEDVIEIRQGVGSEYDISFKKGIYQISKIAAESLGEDSFFWNGEKFIDVGIRSGKAFVITKTSEIRKNMIKPEKSFLIHPHPYDVNEIKRSIRPPSYNDFSGACEYKKMELKNLAVVDSTGMWKYWTDLDLSSKNDSILNRYQDNLRIFFKTRKFSKTTTIDQNLENLIDSSKKLGFELEYNKF